MGTWYSNRLFTVGDTIYFTKYWQNSYSSAAAGVYSGKYSFYATVSECIATGNDRIHNIKFTSLHNTSGTITSGGGYCTPSEVTKGYQNYITYKHHDTYSTSTDTTTHQTGYVGKALTGTAKCTGYTFLGWYTAYPGGSKVTTIPNSDGATYHAHWQANKYTITLNRGTGVSTGTASTTATFDAAMPTITPPTKTGYTFTGYWDASSGGTKYYNANGTSAISQYKTAGAKTLYARYTANTYTVKYNGNGATNTTMSDQTFTYETTQALRTNAFNRGPSWGFIGWNTKSDGSGTDVAANYSASKLTATNGGTVTLYAKWELQYLAPSISNPTIIRYSQNAPDDSGTDLHVEFDWSVDTTIDSSNQIKSILVEYRVSGSGSYSTIFSKTSSFSNPTHDTFSATSSSVTFLTDSNYDIRITLTDTYGYSINADPSVKTDFLSQAFFTMDFAKGGHGVGIGSPAPQDGLNIKMDTAIGEGLVSTGDHSNGKYQTSVGKYNTSQNSSTYAFMVGNGTSNNSRSDAFKVGWNGNVYAGGNVQDGSGNVLNTVASTASTASSNASTAKTATDKYLGGHVRVYNYNTSFYIGAASSTTTTVSKDITPTSSIFKTNEYLVGVQVTLNTYILPYINVVNKSFTWISALHDKYFTISSSTTSAWGSSSNPYTAYCVLFIYTP